MGFNSLHGSPPLPYTYINCILLHGFNSYVDNLFALTSGSSHLPMYIITQRYLANTKQVISRQCLVSPLPTKKVPKIYFFPAWPTLNDLGKVLFESPMNPVHNMNNCETESGRSHMIINILLSFYLPLTLQTDSHFSCALVFWQRYSL